MDQQIIREVLTVTTQQVSPADKRIAARFSHVAMMALDQAESYLLFGPEDARLNVTKSFLSAISRLSAADADEKIAVHRSAFLRTLASMSEDIQPHLTHAETEAITIGTHDQDDD